MNTIDNLLKLLAHNDAVVNNEHISKADKNALITLTKTILSKSYITKNQGNLIIRILKENLENFKHNITSEMIAMIDNPIFEKDFRTLIPVRTINLSIDPFTEHWIMIATVSYSPDALKAVQQSPIWSKKSMTSTEAVLTCELTEKNIIEVVKKLTPHKFDFHEDIINYYNIISAWNEKDIQDQFLLTNIKNTRFQEHLTEELGKDTPVDELIINDRKLRYQYNTHHQFPSNSLTEVIANRPSTKIWVDKSKHSLRSLLASLIILKRLPVLFVFDMQKEAEVVSAMQELSDALESLEITSNIGIYFRLSNQTVGSDFNNLIFKKQYNCVLDKHTLVAGVSSNKLPKFFIENDWRPMSVVSINTSLRHSKTAIYANCCDLVISYTSSEPIIETRHMWEYD